MGSKQLGFGDYEQTTAKKRTRRERFLAEMEVVVPWKALIDVMKPHYPKAMSKGGRPPDPLETMLRIHLLQQWYDLSDPAMEDALIEVPMMRRFAGIELISEYAGSALEPIHGTPQAVLQYVTGRIVSPLRAKYASERQDSAFKKTKSDQSSLKSAVNRSFRANCSSGASFGPSLPRGSLAPLKL
jgi:IS5 family transposase